MKIQGIKSVDFKIVAEGEGVVNWNGSFSVKNEQTKKDNEPWDPVKNHSLPKMRGLDPIRLQRLGDEQLANAKLFVSQNCVRHALFKNENSNLQEVNQHNVDRVLPSILGLVRGFVIADDVLKLSLKRKSALLLEDFVDHNVVLRYEQFSNAGDRTEKSIFSKTNVDSTKYEAFGSISVEDLQFIVLEDSLNRSSYQNTITIAVGKKMEEKMNAFLATLAVGTEKKPQAVFHHNYVRVGAIVNQGEAGLLLNNDAISLVVAEILDRLKTLFIRQSKGYLSTTEVVVDYNDGQAMRIKRSLDNANANEGEYAVYYVAEDMSEDEFVAKMEKIVNDKNAKKKEKAEKAKADKERKEKAKQKNASSEDETSE